MQFNAIPEEQDLEGLERIFQFIPSETTEPKTLGPQDIAAYNRDGYLKPIRAFDDAEAADTRNYFDELLAKIIAEGGDSYSISTAHLKHGRVYDLLTHPGIVSAVRDILGDDVIGWGSHFFRSAILDSCAAPLARVPCGLLSRSRSGWCMASGSRGS